MSSLIVIAQLKTNGGQDRQKVLAALGKAAEYSASKEPGVVKYCIALPRDDDGTSVFAIEEYSSQSTMDLHMISPPVVALLKAFGGSPSLFSGPPTIYGLPNKLSPSAGFARSALLQASDPVIVVSHVSGFTAQSAPGWTARVREIEGKEKGTLTYTVIPDLENGYVRTVAAYGNETAAAKAQTQENAEVWRLKMVAGYLYKEESKA